MTRNFVFAFAAAILATTVQAQAALQMLFTLQGIAPQDGYAPLTDPIYGANTILTSPGSTVYGNQYYDPSLNPTFASGFSFYLVSDGLVSISSNPYYGTPFDMSSFYYAPAYVNQTLGFDMVGTHQDGTVVTEHVDAASSNLTRLNLDANFRGLTRFDIVDTVGTGGYAMLGVVPYGWPPPPDYVPLPSAPALVLPLLAGVPLLLRRRRG